MEWKRRRKRARRHNGRPKKKQPNRIPRNRWIKLKSFLIDPGHRHKWSRYRGPRAEVHKRNAPKWQSKEIVFFSFIIRFCARAVFFAFCLFAKRDMWEPKTKITTKNIWFLSGPFRYLWKSNTKREEEELCVSTIMDTKILCGNRYDAFFAGTAQAHRRSL